MSSAQHSDPASGATAAAAANRLFQRRCRRRCPAVTLFLATWLLLLSLTLVLLPVSSGSGTAAAARALGLSDGFVSIFDGQTLSGWTLVGKVGPGYTAENGVLTCPADGGGNLYTEKAYSDFVLRFEFKLSPGGNNGVAIRAPLGGNAAYAGMEVQVLDDTAPQYADLKPWQRHGSIYGIVPARTGALRPVGEWNREEIRAVGRRITVTLNGRVIVDADLNRVTDGAILRAHPGMMRESGHIGFLGHGSLVQFRNIAIKDLSRPQPDNRAPAGFRALFNGRNLQGWKGLVADPPKRAQMTNAALDEAQKKADEVARAHWKVDKGVLVYDGKGDSLCTDRDFGDFEMLVDWKIGPGADSGIYLRGTPQVQIWDRADVGSGGLFNNEKNPSTPLVRADRPPGEWNRFRILMIGERVSVHLNDHLVVNDVVMENYWERARPIYPSGQIELQHHGAPLFFKNIYIRELPRKTGVSQTTWQKQKKD